MSKLNFQQPLFQSSHDPSEIINMLLIIIVKLIVLPNILWKLKLFFRIFDENVFCLIILNIYCNFWSV